MTTDYVSNAGALPFIQQVYRDFSPELQWSPNFIISIVLEGSLTIHYKNHNRDFQVHDLYFFPPFETFSVTHASPNTRVLSFLVNSTYINTLCPNVFQMKMQQNHLNFNLKNSTYYHLCQDFSTIIFNNLKNEMCTNLKLISAISNVIITIFEAFGVMALTEESPAYATQRIMSILHYINDHYAEKISVQQIASYIGVHPQYFSTFFNKQFHISFSEYLSNYRINRSLPDLRNSDNTIIEIALKNGFSNHKTYASAFRKLYSCSPTEYRKRLTATEYNTSLNISETADSGSEAGIFSFFRQFLQKDQYPSIQKRNFQKQQTIFFKSSDFLHSSAAPHQERFIYVGRAYACLRSEIQQQVRQAKADFNFDYVRIRDIFSDSLYIYYETEMKETIYNWQSLDSVFDFILSLGAKPFPELGYMPDKLASKKQFSLWQYHPNVSAPKSMEKWKALIRNFLHHYIDRYGLQEVQSWYFDFWTSPDLKLKAPYWHESMESFFEFYRATYDVFQSISPSLRLGSPNFSTLDGFSWYESFLQFSYANHIYPAYISARIYGCELRKGFSYPTELNESNGTNFSIANQNLIFEYVQRLQQIMNRTGFRSLDIILSDWNSNFLPKDLIRDTCYMGPYICHTYNQVLSHVKGTCFRSLSDINEDFFPNNTLFGGGPGMMDYHGLKKASYNTFVLLYQLGNRILKQGENYLFVQKGSSYQLLIYNLISFDYMFTLIDKSAMDEDHRYNIYRNTEDLNINIVIQLPSGTYYIKKSEVNRKHGSAYDIWSALGHPAVLHQEAEEYIRSSSVPQVTFAIQDVAETLIIDEIIPAHGVALLEITRKENLTPAIMP